MTQVVSNEYLPSGFADMVRRVPLVEEKLFQVPVGISSVLVELATALHQAIDQMAVKELPVSQQDFVDSFEYLLACRCAYVSGVCRTDTHPKDVEYPALLFPILARVGRYVDTSLNVTIIPIPEIGYQGISEIDGEGQAGLPKVKYHKGKVITEPEKFRAVLAVLRAYGVNTGRGLPMDKDVEDDDVYRLEEVEGAILGSKKEPSTHALYARAMIEMHYLAVLYGEARVQYLAVSSLRSGIYDLVARQVRGPSRRID